MHAPDFKKFENIAATTAAFPLQGGRVQISAVATWGGGNVVLQQIGPDGSTWLPLHVAIEANGVATADVPPGQFRLAVTTATGVYASIASVPNR